MITGGPPDYVIRVINRYALNKVGIPYETDRDASGKHLGIWGFTFPDGKMPSMEQAPLYRAAHFGEETNNREFLIRRADGKMIPIIVSAVPIKDDKGGIVAAINVWRDISEIKRTQNELEEARSRAELYIDLLTHDINNYNAAAMGYLQLAG